MATGESAVGRTASTRSLPPRSPGASGLHSDSCSGPVPGASCSPGHRHLGLVGPTARRSEDKNLVCRVSVLVSKFLPRLLKPSAWHLAGGPLSPAA